MARKSLGKVVRADCGHLEFEKVIIKQFGKTQCRNCARKNNKYLSKLVSSVLKKKA
jgi:hypothetical protein